MKIAVLVSGGVDSSVALALLKNQGYDVTAFYLKIWLEDELAYLGSCPWEEDLDYVQKVCEQLNVPLQIINLQKEYFDRVVKYAIDEVEAGRTPNPDIFCNQRIKFGAFLDAIDSSYVKVATGHYADVEYKDGVFFLNRVPDQIKDQTYFLAHLSQAQVARAIFPIGKYTKKEVRELAHKFNLPTKDRADSQGICFLGKVKYNDFLAHYFPKKTGDFIDVKTGKVLAQHDGYYFHTIGQRKGTGLGHGPWYVVGKDKDKNQVFLSNDEPQLQTRTFTVNSINWISGQPIKTDLKVKLRHGEMVYNCTVAHNNDNTMTVTLTGDAWIAPGQFAVFYDDFVCYGCGTVI